MDELLKYFISNCQPMTEEENKAYLKVLDKVSKPTGRNLFDSFKNQITDSSAPQQ